MSDGTPGAQRWNVCTQWTSHSGRPLADPWVTPSRPRAPTGLRHALRPLHPGVEHLFGGHKENVVGRLLAVHNFQLLHQEADTAVRVLLPHLSMGEHGGVNQVKTVNMYQWAPMSR